MSWTPLANGFAACEDPELLQAICDRLGPGHIRVFAERWRARLPLPFTRADREAGYWWNISMRQVEIATTPPGATSAANRSTVARRRSYPGRWWSVARQVTIP